MTAFSTRCCRLALAAVLTTVGGLAAAAPARADGATTTIVIDRAHPAGALPAASAAR